MTKYKLMIDLTPAGWAYGFPKAVPAEALGGIGQDIFIRNDFDLEKWVVEQGYPETSFQYFRTWTEEDTSMCGGVYEDELMEEFATEYKKESEKKPMGDIKFMTAGDFMDEQKEYYYPGSDPQE